MDSLTEITKWVKSLPSWQREMVVRLWEKGKLTEKDNQDAIRHLKYAHGIEKEQYVLGQETSLVGIKGTIPKDLDKIIVLLSMSELNNVNAIAKNQELTFGQKGLTVIYGDNAAGKSGYSRVLKRACWAREDRNPILGDVFSSSGKYPASARFDFKVDDNLDFFKWKDGQPSRDMLQYISVFDSECARWYTIEKGETRYLPYGMDIFKKLASFCDSIQASLKNEIPQHLELPTAIQSLASDSQVGELIKRIKDADEGVLYESQMKLTPDEVKRYKELEIEMTMKSDEVIRNEIKTIEGKIRRLDNLKSTSKDIFDATNTVAIEKLNKKIADYLTAQSALELSRKEKFGDDYLKGTGSDTWKTMFEAAREFSLIAYPEKDAPFLGESSRCLLCQQFLDKVAKQRFRDFSTYIENFAVKKEQASAEELDTLKDSISSLLDRYDKCDITVIKEVIQNDDAVAVITKKLQKQRQLVKSIIESIESRTEFTTTEPIAEITQDIDSLISEQEKALKEKQDLLKDQTRKQLELERQLLSKRKLLHDNYEKIQEFINRSILKGQIEKCIKECGTTKITIAGSNIIDRVVTKQLCEALDKELEDLNVNVRIKFEESGEKGKAIYVRKFVNSTVEISKILSEGESRAVSIACFLAELNQSGNKKGNKNPIIFDDPVSSLDHNHRELLAKRLVKEAKIRQVIIFTHDIYFFQLLDDEANSQNISIQQRAIMRIGKKDVGICGSEPPFMVKNVQSRISQLETLYDQIRNQYDDFGITTDYYDQIVKFYDMMRSTWEIAVESELFQKTVVRYRSGIQTRQLDEVVVDDELVKYISQGMTNCSKHIGGHDTAGAIGSQAPCPMILLTDLNLLKDFRRVIKNKRGEVKKRRSLSI